MEEYVGTAEPRCCLMAPFGTVGQKVIPFLYVALTPTPGDLNTIMGEDQHWRMTQEMMIIKSS